MTEKVLTLDEVLAEAAQKLASPYNAELLRRSLRGNERVEFRVIFEHDNRGTLTFSLRNVVIARRSRILTRTGVAEYPEPPAEPTLTAGEETA